MKSIVFLSASPQVLMWPEFRRKLATTHKEARQESRNIWLNSPMRKLYGGRNFILVTVAKESSGKCRILVWSFTDTIYTTYTWYFGRRVQEGRVKRSHFTVFLAFYSEQAKYLKTKEERQLRLLLFLCGS